MYVLRKYDSMYVCMYVVTVVGIGVYVDDVVSSGCALTFQTRHVSLQLHIELLINQVCMYMYYMYVCMYVCICTVSMYECVCTVSMYVCICTVFMYVYVCIT